MIRLRNNEGRDQIERIYGPEIRRVSDNPLEDIVCFVFIEVYLWCAGIGGDDA